MISNGLKIEASQFIVTSSLSPETFTVPKSTAQITRGIFITDKSILEAEKESVTLLQFPLESSVTVMEMGSACHVCPPGLFVVHMTTQGNSFKNAEEALFGRDEQPSVLWSLVWKMDSGEFSTTDDCPSNLKFTSGPDAGIDYEEAVTSARSIFSQLCEGEEFLPRAPDPEEIVLDGPEYVVSSVSDEEKIEEDCSLNSD